ncbi:hypothetical protein ACKF11_13760 [Methylobacillus sp. Pita2]|uniref:secretion/conjugation apparatus DotM-related subunit n=1 Tax=Methylobacillus sp. Pita2 TaxID=3383245 RepID=UPI0038B48085
MAQQGEDNSSVITKEMWAGIGLLLFGVAFWFMFHTPFTIFAFGIWQAEIWVVNLFTNALAPIGNWMTNAEPEMVKFDQFFAIATEVGSYTRFFWVPVLAGLAGWMLFTDTKSKFNKRMTLESLSKSFEPLWPHASMGFSTKNLKHFEPGVGKGSALKPREFARKYKLLDQEGELKLEATELVLVKQLGPKFVSFAEWNKPGHQYKLCLAALFFLKYHRQDEEFKEFRNALAREFNATGDIVSLYPKAWEVVQAHMEFFEVKEKRTGYFYRYLKKRHAYETTFLYSMFGKSKRGVFAPCEFRWLKTKNRTLWYALNSVDRRVAWTEAMGVKAHWWAEIASNKAIRTPVISEAIIGLKEALKEIRERTVEET